MRIQSILKEFLHLNSFIKRFYRTKIHRAKLCASHKVCTLLKYTVLFLTVMTISSGLTNYLLSYAKSGF